ncbi:MAG: metal-dependent transcriptional regulator [Actinomycetales bacterium]|nr:metal-dependent transcriptional regulator [Actinomycetales bacterium]
MTTLTPATQDYLKVVWAAREWDDDGPTTTALAARLGLSVSSVSDGVKRLTAQGLLEHAPYGSIGLTDEGRDAALAVVRKHRLIETFLVEYLGYGWDEVHDEAEVLEHAVSDEFVERLAARLGHPERDPHGDPIPARDGTVPRPAAVRLSALAEGARGVVARVSDAEPALLRYFAQVGLVLDAPVRVLARRELVGTVEVEVGEAAVSLGLAAADAVWVTTEG